jgi:PAS domain S-box-containing protein
VSQERSELKQASADLLALACARIGDLARPAFIKDHMLRYVAVNDAYAYLVGSTPEALAGRPSSPFERDGRDAAERAALTSDDGVQVMLRDAWGTALGEADVERFITDDGSIYLFGRMTEPAVRTEGSSAETALELLNIGTAVFDDARRLVSCNAQWRAFFEPFVGRIEPGLALSDFYRRMHDYAMTHFPEEKRALMPPRDEWVAGRLAKTESDAGEATEQVCDGRWLKGHNRRLDNGGLLMVRLDVSDLKQQEFLLRRHVEENQLYQSIIEELPVSVFARDTEHRMVYVNEAFTSLFGYSREHLIGKTEVEAYGAGGLPMAENNAQVFATGRTSSVEERIEHPAGGHFEAITRVSRVDTENGDRYVVGSIIDISELKLREEALREAQARAESLSHDLSGILSALPAGVLVFDDHLTVEYVNQSLFNICGLSPGDDLRGKAVHHAIESIYLNVRGQEGEDGSLLEKLSLLFERGSEATLEFLTREGKAVIAVSRNLTGGKTLVTFADISALREQEREVTETRRKLENIGQFMHDAAGLMSQGLFVVQDGVITLSNQAAATIMCVPQDLVEPGRHWINCFGHCAARGDFGTEAEAAAVRARWSEMLQQNGSITHTFLAAGRSWVQFTATISDRGHVMVVINDMTEVKQREVELERLLARSEAADRAKSDFLANMGHEIRTPINGVLGMAELLTKTDLDARQRTFTEIITKSANTLLTIFNDILDFSKIDSGQMELKPAPFDPVDAVEDVASLHSAAASEKNLELLVRLSGQLPKRVMGDAGRFRQIVANFVSNAIRHTERGHVLVDVSAEADGPGRVMLVLRVEDTGVGIPADKLESIFEKFSQGTAAKSFNAGGTGLGLAITSGLVQLFGGSISAESVFGRGSAFIARLPFAVIDAGKEARPVPVMAQGARVLVVDDNEVSRSILVRHLEDWGFDACAADSGESALMILDAASDLGVPVDAVLVDYHMARRGGADFCRHIRASGRHHALALILLTSLDAAADASGIEELQVQAQVTKPVRANILRNTVIEVLRARHARRQTGDRLETVNAFASRLPQMAITLPELPKGMTAPGEPPRVRIVVAEDNEVNAIVFRQILEAAGHVFALASNGEEAIALWQKHKPDVILMDVSMPVMDGLEAARRIRHMERVADLPPVAIVAVTAFDTDSGRELCLTHGMDDYIAKPISPEALEAKIKPFLDRERPSEMPGE